MEMTAKPDRRARVGSAAETAARRHLERAGCRVVAQNVRWREGELDLICVDRAALVFIEVKALVERDGAPPFSPFESIGLRKQRRVRSLARRWICDELPRMRDDDRRAITSIRFDAIAVTMTSAGAITSIEHLADAF